MKESDTESDTDDRVDAAQTDASDTPKRKKRSAVRPITQAKLFENLDKALAKERSARIKAESEVESMRVQINILEMEIKEYEDKEQQEADKRYEGVEGYGDW